MRLGISDEFFMREALKQAQMAFARDEVPVGAVIVHDNQMIAKAHNQVEMLKDPTAHAEMLAITQAATAVSSKWLNDSTLYVTLEPCSMCAGALVLARIKKIIFGTFDPKTGACGSIANIVQHKQLNHTIELHQGLLSDECSDILSLFFRNKRQEKQINEN